MWVKLMKSYLTWGYACMATSGKHELSNYELIKQRIRALFYTSIGEVTPILGYADRFSFIVFAQLKSLTRCYNVDFIRMLTTL